MNISTAATALTIVTTLLGGGWYAHETLATKDEVLVAGGKANTALDLQMEDLISKIARRRDAKKNKTNEELEQLKYWRALLERLRKTRSQQG